MQPLPKRRRIAKLQLGDSPPQVKWCFERFKIGPYIETNHHGKTGPLPSQTVKDVLIRARNLLDQRCLGCQNLILPKPAKNTAPPRSGWLDCFVLGANCQWSKRNKYGDPYPSCLYHYQCFRRLESREECLNEECQQSLETCAVFRLIGRGPYDWDLLFAGSLGMLDHLTREHYQTTLQYFKKRYAEQKDINNQLLRRIRDTEFSQEILDSFEKEMQRHAKELLWSVTNSTEVDYPDIETALEIVKERTRFQYKLGNILRQKYKQENPPSFILRATDPTRADDMEILEARRVESLNQDERLKLIHWRNKEQPNIPHISEQRRKNLRNKISREVNHNRWARLARKIELPYSKRIVDEEAEYRRQRAAALKGQRDLLIREEVTNPSRANARRLFLEINEKAHSLKETIAEYNAWRKYNKTRRNKQVASIVHRQIKEELAKQKALKQQGLVIDPPYIPELAIPELAGAALIQFKKTKKEEKYAWKQQIYEEANALKELKSTYKEALRREGL